MNTRFLRCLLALLLVGPALGCSNDARTPLTDGGAMEDAGKVPPRSVTFDECREMGGTVVLDPGDGRTYRDGCPRGDFLGGLMSPGCEPLCGEGGICCRP